MTEGFSVADALALQNRDGYGDGMFGGGSWWAIMLFFLLAWGRGGFGFGENAAMQGALTRADLCEGFNFNDLQRRTQGISNGLCDGFYAMNNSMLQGFNALGAQIAENRFAQKECCCETNRNIDALRYETAKQTCDIMANNDRNTQRVIDMFTQNTIQELRDKLQEARSALDNSAQSQYLINELRPCAKPAYITCSPYTTFGGNCNGGYGYGFNGGCCN